MTTKSKFFVSLLIVGVLLTACASQATAVPPTATPQVTNPYAPQAGDDLMTRGVTEIVSASVLATGSLPSEVSVALSYRLPTPCNQLRVEISQPDAQNRIQLSIYALAPKDKPCTLMALSTPMETSLNLGSFAAGQYTVWINGQQVGEFGA
jgi:hypothetical protein